MSYFATLNGYRASISTNSSLESGSSIILYILSFFSCFDQSAIVNWNVDSCATVRASGTYRLAARNTFKASSEGPTFLEITESSSSIGIVDSLVVLRCMYICILLTNDEAKTSSNARHHSWPPEIFLSSMAISIERVNCTLPSSVCSRSLQILPQFRLPNQNTINCWMCFLKSSRWRQRWRQRWRESRSSMLNALWTHRYLLGPFLSWNLGYHHFHYEEPSDEWLWEWCP